MAIFPDVTGQVNGLHQPTARHIDIVAWTEQGSESINTITVSTSTPIRGTSVSLAIPLDDRAAKGTAGAEYERTLPEATATNQPRREPLRRDSLKRHRLLTNPWAQPPLPSDWEVQPTYPKHSVPYYLAPLWDATKQARESAEAMKRKNHIQRSQAPDGTGKVPKELREKLKKSKAAKGLLQDLEEQVRNFVQQWEAKNAKPAPAPKPDLDLDSDEEEIVFVGRNGVMHDVPQSPHAVMDDFDEDDIKRDKLVFDSLADDHGASFGRWLVHSIATYYDLQTWSVTTGRPARREAYVGLKSSRPSSGPLPRPLWGMV
ncbi:MAG: hypothetical protein Q9182_005598 [Xanthomendoza sp. 2 TL-2023]